VYRIGAAIKAVKRMIAGASIRYGMPMRVQREPFAPARGLLCPRVTGAPAVFAGGGASRSRLGDVATRGPFITKG
jgi:hypothetical protein